MIAVDPDPLAPARYAAHVHAPAPPFADPAYLPAISALCAEHAVDVVLPLTDLDIALLAEARERGELPALVAPPDVARATQDKLETHALLERHGLPSPATTEPGAWEGPFPVIVKPRLGSGSRGIFRADDHEEIAFLARYAREPVVVQRLLSGPHVSIDTLSDAKGRCLNAIPRLMIESRGGELVKGKILDDADLVALGARAAEALRVRGPGMFQVFRDEDAGPAIHDVNLRFGGGFPAHVLAARPGRTYPELVLAIARGEAPAPHVGDFRAGIHVARFNWQIELDEHHHPTPRDIVDPPGPPPPRS